LKAIWTISIITSILILGTFGLTQNVFAACRVCADFNGDGFDDLAIGVPSEDLSGSNQGAVNVIYGSSSGLSVNNVLLDQFWHQNRPGVAEIAGDNEQFGDVLAFGDFNMDGFDDLVVGVPFENVNVGGFDGAVNVIYGSASGLHVNLALNDQLWHQDSTKLFNCDGESVK